MVDLKIKNMVSRFGFGLFIIFSTSTGWGGMACEEVFDKTQLEARVQTALETQTDFLPAVQWLLEKIMDIRQGRQYPYYSDPAYTAIYFSRTKSKSNNGYAYEMIRQLSKEDVELLADLLYREMAVLTGHGPAVGTFTTRELDIFRAGRRIFNFEVPFISRSGAMKTFLGSNSNYIFRTGGKAVVVHYLKDHMAELVFNAIIRDRDHYQYSPLGDLQGPFGD